MNDKLKSRKLWMFMLSLVVLGVLAKFGAPDGAYTALWTITVAYLGGQSAVDATRR